MATKTLIGPRGITLELDTDQVFPDDPGNGTPAMVTMSGGYSATYWCALGEGELSSDRGDKRIPCECMKWLAEQEDAVQAFLYPPSA